MISPNRSNRKQKTQDGRPRRRYRRRWKVERLFAWMQNYRRLVTRWEYHIETSSDMYNWLACSCCSGIYEMASKLGRCALTASAASK
jgi:transposase